MCLTYAITWLVGDVSESPNTAQTTCKYTGSDIAATGSDMTAMGSDMTATGSDITATGVVSLLQGVISPL